MQLKADPSSEVKRAYTIARKYFQAGNLHAAQQAAEALLQATPQFASGRRLYADILVGLGQFPAARAQLEKALALFPQDTVGRQPIYLHMATTFIREGDMAGALGVLQSPDLAPEGDLEAGVLTQLGYLLTLCESHQKALQIFEAALSERPDDPLFLFNCAAANRAMGNLERAEALYDRALALNPEDWEAYKNRSDLRKQTADSNHVSELRQQLQRKDLPAVASVQLHFSLAKEYEDLGDYPASFDCLQRGCQTRRKTIDYQLGRDQSVMSGIADRFGPGFLAGGDVAESQGQEVIFILGMPRTGSTLLDRLLCASGEVESAGEPDTFARMLLRQANTTGERKGGRNVILDAGEDLNIGEVGAAYVRQLAARAQLAGASRIIDKNPMNFLYLGWIARALPGAKIIHLRRNPMDTCYAIYKTLFKSAYPFSYDQVELAGYYAAYRTLMRHWKSVFNDRIIEVHYEDLVTDLSAEGKKLYEACGLAWHDSVMDAYYTQGKGTATASAAQVRQPVYRSSVNKWHHLHEQLAPMQEILTQAGIVYE